MADVFTWTPPADAIPLWDGTPPGYRPDFDQPVPTLTPFRVSSSSLTSAVVVLPGGGYGMKAAHEAAPVAQWLNGLGISAFVLDYRVAPYRHPVPLLDARRAIQYVRSRAAEWAIDPNKIGILGFSAGGHLASTVGTHFESLSQPEDAVAQESFIPNAMILCYPVITFIGPTHIGSMENLFGQNPSRTLLEQLSNETQVTPETPPTFLWHTADDDAVPVENSLSFARSLNTCHVPFEIHVFAHGDHGVGLAQGHPYAEPWTSLCEKWLQNLGYTHQG